MTPDQDDIVAARRARTREIQAEFAIRGDSLRWFDALYQEAAGDNEKIPWADLEPNRYLQAWAVKSRLTGNGRSALVVGCGLGDDAKYLDDLGFKVTGFDISPTAIEWAKRLHSGTDIRFEVMDLFEPFSEWLGAFEFVVEVYTIQALPLSMRETTIDAIASFVAPGGELVVVSRLRADYDEPDELPWPVSVRELKRFANNGLKEIHFETMPGEADEPERFVAVYKNTLER
ncbi:methyltransferase domain-containing protein [soil metagenome]